MLSKDDFEEIDYDDELAYEQELKERQHYYECSEYGDYNELEENPCGWSAADFIKDDEAMTDEELDQAEEDYFNSNDDDLEYFNRVNSSENPAFRDTFNDVGSLADVSDIDDMPLFKSANSTNIKLLPPAKPYKRHFSLKEFISGLFYRGAGCLFFKKENGKIFILLEKRAAGMHYGNQWTIPGGGSENSDDCALDTALRESDEEIDYFHKHLSSKYYEKADRLHTSRWLTYHYDYFIVKTDENDSHYVWGPQPGEVSKVRWFNIKILPKNCHKTIRWLIFIAKIKNLMK